MNPPQNAPGSRQTRRADRLRYASGKRDIIGTNGTSPPPISYPHEPALRQQRGHKGANRVIFGSIGSRTVTGNGSSVARPAIHFPISASQLFRVFPPTGDKSGCLGFYYSSIWDPVRSKLEKMGRTHSYYVDYVDPNRNPTRRSAAQPPAPTVLRHTRPASGLLARTRPGAVPLPSWCVHPIADAHSLARQPSDTCGCLASPHAELGLSAPGNTEPQLGAHASCRHPL